MLLCPKTRNTTKELSTRWEKNLWIAYVQLIENAIRCIVQSSCERDALSMVKYGHV